jgi:protein-disulfide isomerase
MASSHISARTITLIIVGLCLLFAAGAYSLGVMNMKAELPKEEAAQTSEIDTTLLAVTPEDVVIGTANAPVTIIEYSSLSCPHCAHFHTKVLPELTKKYFDTGKARIVLRQFPLNAPALKAALMVNCAAADERINFIKVLFEGQSDWAFSKSFIDSLKQIGALGGINGERFEACVNDKKAEEALIAATQAASEKLSINSTPSFFINNTMHKGELNAEALGKAIDAISDR